MRHTSWLSSLVLLAACASSAPPPPSETPPATAAPPATTAERQVESPPAPVAHDPPQGGSASERACVSAPVKLGGKFAPKPLDPALQTKLATCGGAAVPDDCRWSVARAYYDANHVELAAPIFGDLAQAGPKNNYGPYSAQLYLDSLNILGTESDPPREVCNDAIGAATASLLKIYCAPPTEQAAALCSTLQKIDVDIQRLAAERLVRIADKGDGDGPALYRKAGEIYAALFDARCAFRRTDPRRKAEAPPGWEQGRCAEIAYNAMRAFQAGHDATRSDAARAWLTDPQNQLDKTPLGKRAAQK